MSVILSITLALFVLGLFGLLIIHTNNLTRMIKENVEVQVYLQKEITNAQKTKIQKTLGSDDYVLTSEGQPEIIFVSKEEAAEEFEKSTGENFSEFFAVLRRRRARSSATAATISRPRASSGSALSFSRR